MKRSSWTAFAVIAAVVVVSLLTLSTGALGAPASTQAGNALAPGASQAAVPGLQHHTSTTPAASAVSGQHRQNGSVNPLSYVLPIHAHQAQAQSLSAIVEGFVAAQPGTWAVLVRNLETGESAEVNADMELNVASVYKLQVLNAAYVEERNGNLSFDEQLPEGWTVREAIQAMITVSDTDATFALLRRIGTPRVNAITADLGMGSSYIGEWGYSTARDTAVLLELIASGALVDSEASAEMLDLLLAQQINDRLPAYLPGGVVAHKTGELPGIRNDAGIVYGPSGPYVMVVLTSDLPDVEAGAAAIAELSRQVYDYFS